MPPDSQPRRGTAPRRPRPQRREVDPAALALIERHGAQVMATARRYSATPEDAEDAYQRALEILLTKAPTTHEDELVPWLKTVVKHEAYAIRRQRERAAPTTDDGELADAPASGAATHDQAERYDRLSVGAEALRRLKPQELRCLVLKAEGYSYKEICRITGWTYTKVNRCLTEGRRAFLELVAGIERGAECERLQASLSALADGEASAEEVNGLRPHLKTCLACRARLRAYRQAPARIAALAPAGALAAQADAGPLRSILESLAGAAQHKAAALGDRLHAAAELATGNKVAAVAASTAALAGGGATVDRVYEQGEARGGHERPEAAPAPRPAVRTVATRTVPLRPAGEPADPTPPPTAAPPPAALDPPPRPPEQSPGAAAPPPPPGPAREFGPAGTPAAPARTMRPPPSPPMPPDGTRTQEFRP